MKFFKNESESVTVGGLTLDNRLDAVSLSGDIDLTLDRAGLALAEELLEQLQGIVGAMKEAEAAGTLAEKIERKPMTPAGNLFGLPGLPAGPKGSRS